MRRLIIAATVLAVSAPAFARDDGRYAGSPQAIRQWFSAQHNGQGAWCCDNADGHLFDGNYTFGDDGSVVLDMADGTKHVLPAFMVLTGPNPTGHAVWWYLESAEAGHIDYCFAKGPLG